MREFLAVELKTEDGKVPELEWSRNPEKRRAVQRRHLGKQILMTSRHDWDCVSIVRAYRRLTRTEDLFRISKSRPGVWWPLFHWTDSKIRVHALYCFLALVLLAILRLQLHRAGCSVSVDRAVRRLKDIDEILGIYTNGAADCVLTELDDTQMEIARLAASFGAATLEECRSHPCPENAALAPRQVFSPVRSGAARRTERPARRAAPPVRDVRRSGVA